MYLLCQLMCSVASQGSKHNLVRDIASCQHPFRISSFKLLQCFMFLQEDRETQQAEVPRLMHNNHTRRKPVAPVAGA